MTDELRAAIAFIVGNKDKDNKHTYNRLFDHKRAKYIPYNIQIIQTGFYIYDYDRGTYLNGNKNYIYDFETEKNFNISYFGDCFFGLDMNNNTHFQGKISGNSIYIYDSQYDEYYNYMII